jgi:hypothetical protein
MKAPARFCATSAVVIAALWTGGRFSEAVEPPRGSPERAAILATLRTLVEADLGAPIAFRLSRIEVDGEWAYVAAVPTRGGQPLDWATTRFADAFAKDTMSNRVLALFHRESDGSWRTAEYALGPTDVAWVDWIGKYGAPRSLFTPADPSAAIDAETAPIEGAEIPAAAAPTAIAAPVAEPAAGADVADVEKALDAALGRSETSAPTVPPPNAPAEANPPHTTLAVGPSPSPPSANAQVEQRTRWAKIAGAQDPKEFARFLQDYPDSPFAAEAANNLGALLSNGSGVAPDLAAAAQLFQFAADRGNSHAANNLGNMYATGAGVAKDDARAAALYRRGADLGHPDAMTNLGIMLAGGRGVARDDVEAAALYRRAGNANGMMLLAGMFDAGRGVGRDPGEAARLYLESLRLGQPISRQILIGQRAKSLTVETRRAIQRRLSEAGTYTGAIDGVFGPAVLSALERWT